MSEILAPAGDIISLKCAIASGADAVYLGLSAFNARIKAPNFTIENIAETVDYCHLFGVKVYITLNISIKNRELDDVRKVVIACKNARIDAFIVTDLAVLSIIKEECPNIPIHASTQFGVCNLEGAKFAESVGFSRVVLSREATLDEIIAIRKNTNLEIEYFVHGALCVAFSGKCLMSSMINGGSGNRGRCLQPCRLKYNDEKSGKSGYLLSTSDLCLVESLKTLNDAGVCSFKIEGRLRRPEYVYNTVKTYREVVDNNFNVKKENIDLLKSSYNRGNFTRGYSFDDAKDLMSIKVQGNMGIYAGTIISQKNGFSKISGNFNFKIGQGYKLFDENENEILGGQILDIKDNLISIKGAKIGYRLNITSDGNFDFFEKKLPVSVNFELKNNKLSLKIRYKNFEETSEIFVENAKKSPIDFEILKSSFSKFGDSVFFVTSISGKIEGAYFAPRSALNSLRRDVIDKLYKIILNNYKYANSISEISTTIIKNSKLYNNLIAIELQTPLQLCENITRNADIIVFFPDEFSVFSVNEFLKNTDKTKVYLKLPANAREKDICIIKDILLNTNIEGLYCDSPYSLEIANEYKLKTFLGIGLNIYNKSSLSQMPYNYYVVSPELNSREIAEFNSPFVFAYGYIPLMNLSHCVTKLLSECDCNNCKYDNGFTYCDRKNYRFNIYRNKVFNCYFTLYNCKIHDISGKAQNFSFNYYLNMLKCNKNEIENIIFAFKNKTNLSTNDKTNGHFVNGVL